MKKIKVVITKNSDGEIVYSNEGEESNFRSLFENDIARLGLDNSQYSIFWENTSKKDLVKEAYDSMVKDIYDQMETVFGTRNDVSAAAFASTWEAMVQRPDAYVDAELGFADATAVLSYANTQIAAADAYGVFRLKRIAAYRAAVEAL